MDIFIVGAGKLALELLEQPPRFGGSRVHPWVERGNGVGKSIVVHAGSGRELPDVCAFCAETGSLLLELSTGSEVTAALGFPVILCANTNILMLKFMSMVRTSGHLFKQYAVSVTESHQATKKSVPGTAVHIAESLGVDASEVRSIRDVESPRHAFHEIVIEDGGCTVKLQSRVEGMAPYADGVATIVRAVSSHPLENRLYEVTELIESGWL